MKTHILLSLLVVCTICSVNGFMGLDLFGKTIQRSCLDELDPRTNQELTNGQLLPLPNTIEAFIGLVEKLEYRHPEWRAVDVIKTLLLNFRYDDVVIKGQAASTRGGIGSVGLYYTSLVKLFSNPSSGLQLRADDLSPSERCALFYMISHTVNETVREGEETIDIGGERKLKYRREHGIVTLTSQTKHAFALGKVLLGLLAGIERTEPASASSIFKDVKGGDPPEFLDSVLVNVLYSATFGDVISVTKDALNDNSINQPIESLFYQNGRWEGALCQVHYFLEEDHFAYHHASFSLIRGAIDGYRLGSSIKQLVNMNSKLRLSQVLRMYYSGSGFPGFPELSYCNRINLRMEKLKQEAINFDKLYSAITDKIPNDRTTLEDIEKMLNLITNSESKILSGVNEENDNCNSISFSGSRCETPVDLIAIMDWKAVEQRSSQSDVIGNLSSGINFGGAYGSSVSLYTNLKAYGGGFDLDAVTNTSHVSGCAGCAAAHYNPTHASYNSEAEVFQYLNSTLGRFTNDDNDDEGYGVPAKVIAYFNYQNAQDESRLRTAIYTLHWRFRGVKIFAIGNKENNLRIFTDDYGIVTNVNTEKLRQLKTKVCKVPAQFQYKNCYKRDAALEKNERYEGFITPRHSQYWMMDPKFFHRSFNIKLTFKALFGEIRVCFSRDSKRIFDGREANAAECGNSSPESEVTFRVDNPCNKVTMENCDPFYFYIEGRTAPKDNEPCKDNKCKTLDQISYEFTHEGVSCNDATLKIATSSLFFFLLFVSFWNYSSV